MKKLIFEALEIGEYEDRLSKTVDLFLILLIILSVLAVVLESVSSIYAKYGLYFRIFELFSVSVFTLEYGLRIWTCNLKEQYKGAFTGRLKYIFSLAAIIDLLAILPFFLPFFTSMDLRFLRIFRLVRVFKLTRYSKTLQKFDDVIINKKDELLVTIGLTFLLLLSSSSIMYFVENQAQPDKFASIPDAMWWGVATLTTVGYGDVYPVTIVGKLFATFVVLLSIGIVALPTGIINAGFMEELNKEKEKEKSITCPHCGKNI